MAPDRDRSPDDWSTVPFWQDGQVSAERFEEMVGRLSAENRALTSGLTSGPQPVCGRGSAAGPQPGCNRVVGGRLTGPEAGLLSGRSRVRLYCRACSYGPLDGLAVTQVPTGPLEASRPPLFLRAP